MQMLYGNGLHITTRENVVDILCKTIEIKLNIILGKEVTLMHNVFTPREYKFKKKRLFIFKPENCVFSFKIG